MYRRLYNKASEMADLIQERISSPETRESSALMDNVRQGLVKRRQGAMEAAYGQEEEGIADVIASYISNIRSSNPVEAIEDYISDDEPDMSQASGTWNFDEISDFASRLAMSESSNRSDIQIQTQSGGREQNMTGLFQFSDGRLEDYMNDTGASFSTEDFRMDPNLQRDVFAWHINDIDRVIRQNDLLEQGFDLDGLRAVAHLGGVTGMLRYARSGGEYDPQDEFGTNLSDYYNRFSGN